MAAIWLMAVMVFADAPVKPAPVRILFDTDMDSDCDDAGALALLHTLADKGEAEILAVLISGLNPHSGPCADAINTYHGRPNIAIGSARAPAPKQGSKYAEGIAKRFPHKLKSTADAPDALELYRTILEAGPDAGTVIVTVGDLTNLARLVKLPAQGDRLSGVELIRKKVKLWVCMGGNFLGSPAHDDLKLGNNNFTLDKAATHTAITQWPGPIVFAGREVCSVPSGLQAGAGLAKTPAENPVRLAYELFLGGPARDRHVADQVAVLFAVRGAGERWNLHSGGFMDIQPDCTFTWRDTPDRKQAYLLKRLGADGKPNDRAIEREIEELMTTPPRK